MALPTCDLAFRQKKKQPPRASFPLPTELKDEIYSYLLHPERVKFQPCLKDEGRRISDDHIVHGNTAPAYNFHAIILSINKTIRDEAAAYLHKHCSFVILDLAAPGLTKMLHLWDVPIVADQKLDNFTRHAVSIQVNWNSKLIGDILDPTGQDDSAMRPVLILAKDLPRVFEALRFVFSFLTPMRPRVVAGAHISLPAPSESIHTPKFIVQINEELCSPAQEKEMLAELREVVGAGYHFALKSRCTEQEASDLAEHIGPDIIWPGAQAWSLLRLAWKYKARADELALAGNYEAAASRLVVLLNSARLWDGTIGHWMMVEHKDRALTSAYERWGLLMFDCSIARIHLAMRMGIHCNPSNLSDASWFSRTARINGLTSTSKKMRMTSQHALILVGLMRLDSRGRRENFSTILTWGDPIDHETDPVGSKYVAHDIRIIQDYFSGGRDEIEDPPWKELSCNVLPVRVFDHHSECKLPGRFEGLDGWQDVQHLNRLSHEEKKEIDLVTKAISPSMWEL